jgi:RimJ/RimL family protein N-acetyltransferase
VVRAASRSVAAVTPAEHEAWFASRLADPDTRLFVVELGGAPIGQVRVDRIEGALGEIHIALAETARGRGRAAAVLRDAACRGAEQLGLTALEAHVRAGNQPSLRAFERAGFSEQSRDDDWVVLRWARR